MTATFLGTKHEALLFTNNYQTFLSAFKHFIRKQQSTFDFCIQINCIHKNSQPLMSVIKEANVFPNNKHAMKEVNLIKLPAIKKMHAKKGETKNGEPLLSSIKEVN